MKKLIKMMLTLATTTTIPLTVVACGQTALDGTLSAIYKGETNYLIDNLVPGKKHANQIVTAPYSLTTDEITTLAQNIAKNILDAAKLPLPTWYQKDTPVNQKCYNFNITNGTDETTGKHWDVNWLTQRITIKISYLVGSVASDGSFKANQKIDMSFNIKVGTSQHDIDLNNWIKLFNQQTTNNPTFNPIQVNLDDLKVDLPGTNASWSDLDKKIVAVANDAIGGAIGSVANWPGNNNVAWNVKGMGTVTSDKKLQLTLNVNYGDSQTGDGIAPNVSSFYIQFNKK